MREYLLAFPGYASMCGGIKSGHMLCKKLNERGYKAYVTGDYTNPAFGDLTPKAKDLSQEHLRDLQHNGIIVMPDIVPNNPARFTNCVKYFLGASQVPPENQLVFSFSEMHDVVHKNENHLFVWHIEDFFTEPPEGTIRSGSATYAGKGSGIDHSPVVELTGNADNSVNPSGSIRITPGFPSPREKLAELFKRIEVLYCYDNLSVIATEARLCGCPVVIMGHWVIPREHYGLDEFGLDGICLYGEEEIDLENLRSQFPAFRERYKLREEKTEKELDIFIEKTQEWNKEGMYLDDPGPYLPTLYGHKNFALFGTR